MHEYAHHSFVYGVFRPVVYILQIRFLNHTNNLLDKRIFHFGHLTEQAHFFGVRYLYIGVRMYGRVVLNDERTRVSMV